MKKIIIDIRNVISYKYDGTREYETIDTPFGREYIQRPEEHCLEISYDRNIVSLLIFKSSFYSDKSWLEEEKTPSYTLVSHFGKAEGKGTDVAESIISSKNKEEYNWLIDKIIICIEKFNLDNNAEIEVLSKTYEEIILEGNNDGMWAFHPDDDCQIYEGEMLLLSIENSILTIRRITIGILKNEEDLTFPEYIFTQNQINIPGFCFNGLKKIMLKIKKAT